ncbi:MAG TPA: ABC transporter substrate-binding protein [Chloroflexota bacterium]
MTSGPLLIRTSLVALALLTACGSAAVPPSSTTSPAGSPPASQAASAAVSSSASPAVKPVASSAAPSAIAGTAASAGLQPIVEAAKKEGELNFQWNAGLVMSPNSGDAWAAALNQMYGTNLKITYTPGPPIPQMAAKTSDEVKSNRPTGTDVLITDPFPLLSLTSEGIVGANDWSWAPSLQEQSLIAPGNYGVEFVSLLSGITYSTNKIKDPPKSMADLLKPEYKGRIATTAAAIHFIELAAAEVWGEQKTVDYVTNYAKQVAGFINCAELSRVASGEFDLFAIDCGSTVSDAFKARGAPLAQAVPSDAPVYTPLYMTIPKTSAHPNAAKLWINFVLSQPGQQLLYKETFGDDATLPGSKMAEVIDKVRQSGGKPIKADMQFYQRNDAQKMQQTANRLIDILHSSQK